MGNAASGTEAGAAGTVYVENTDTGFTTLQVDNNGQSQVAEQTEIENEGYRIDLSASASYNKDKTFTSADGHVITSSTNTYSHSSSWWCFYYGSSTSSFALMNLFDQTLSDNREQYYLSSAGTATITIQLANNNQFINHLKIFPTASFPSRFKVKIGSLLAIFLLIFEFCFAL